MRLECEDFAKIRTKETDFKNAIQNIKKNFLEEVVVVNGDRYMIDNIKNMANSMKGTNYHI